MEYNASCHDALAKKLSRRDKQSYAHHTSHTKQSSASTVSAIQCPRFSNRRSVGRSYVLLAPRRPSNSETWRAGRPVGRRTNGRFPQFRCRSSVAVSPFPLAVAVAAAVAYLFAVYGCNGTEFSYVIFTEQRNFTTAERRNGNGRTATDWWKSGITLP